MRLHKLLSLMLSAILPLSLCGCHAVKRVSPDHALSSSAETENASALTEENPNCVVNPLTGVRDLPKEKAGQKPAAVTINNIAVAQNVQCGVGDADLIIETEVEGGITRLLGFYQNPTASIQRIGTVRSARVVFAELAAGFNSVLVHCGIDKKYCLPLITQQGIPRKEIWDGLYGKRYPNGLAVEHTFYTSGANLASLLQEQGHTQGGTTEPFFSFATETITPADGTADIVTAKFNASRSTQFLYDAATATYQRAQNSIPYQDALSGEKETFRNVFVLKTSMSYYADGLHRNISLSGGSGYYISNGGYETITWSKGNLHAPLSFRNANGEELHINPGNSYICLINQSSGTMIAE